MRPDYEKIIQSINYFARKQNNNKISKLYFLKLIFLADRYHLRMYGRTITNDHYVAMQYGPVASETKSTFEFLNIPEPMQAYAAEYLLPAEDSWITSRKEVDSEVFSETDMEALEAAWSTFKKHRNLVSFTHNFPEWSRHEQKLATYNASKMELEDFFMDAPKGVEYCPATPERVAMNRDFFMEMAHLM